MERESMMTICNTVKSASAELLTLQTEIASVKTHINELTTRIGCLAEYLAAYSGIESDEVAANVKQEECSQEGDTSFYKRTRKRRNYEQ